MPDSIHNSSTSFSLSVDLKNPESFPIQELGQKIFPKGWGPMQLSRLNNLIAIAYLSTATVGYGSELPEPFQAVGAAGMGNAATAVAADDEAVWTNPAGISRIRKARSRKKFHTLKFPGLIAGFNQDGKDAAKSLLGKTGESSIESVQNNIEKLQDKPFWGRVAAFPMTQFDLGKDKPVSFGVYSNTNMQIVADKDNNDSVRMQGISDQGLVVGFALPTPSNRFSIGFQARPIFRYAYEDSIPAEVFALSKEEKTAALKTRLKDGANKTKAVAYDAGLIWTLADFWYPTIGLAVFNASPQCKDDYLNPYSQKRERVCGTVYTGDIGNEEALSTVDPTDFRVGFSVAPRLHRELGMRFSFDVHHLYVTQGSSNYGLTGVDIQKMLHAGVELYTGNPLEVNPFALRVGAGQGFASWGVVMRSSFATLSATYYGRDISSESTPQEDRRFLGGLSIDL